MDAFFSKQLAFHLVLTAPPHLPTFVYGHEAEFIQGFLKVDKKLLAQKFNFTHMYIDDCLYKMSILSI